MPRTGGAATNGAQQQISPAQARQMQMAGLIRQFRRNTRKRYNYAGPAVSVTAGGYQMFPLPQVGLLARVYLYFDLVCSTTNQAAASTRLHTGPFLFVNRMQLVSNLGTNNIWDTDGFSGFLNNISKLRYPVTTAQGTSLRGWMPQPPAPAGFAPVDSGTIDTDHATFPPLFQYPDPHGEAYAANATWNVRFMLRIDVNANDGLNFAQGLINLQSPQVQASINLSFAQAAQLYNLNGDTMTIAGTVTPVYEYYEIPSAMRHVPLPTGLLHCTLQQTATFNATGDIPYQIPRQGLLLRLQEVVTLNSVLSGAGGAQGVGTQNQSALGVDTFWLKLQNGQDTIYQKPFVVQLMDQFENYGVLPLGCYIHELFNAMSGTPGSGDFRDVIDTEAVTTTQFITTINSGATLGGGANANKLDFTREILLPFKPGQSPVAAAA